MKIDKSNQIKANVFNSDHEDPK